MIMTAFFTALQDAINWFVSVRPSWNPTIDPSVAQLLTWLGNWDWALPIHECFATAASLAVLHGVMSQTKWLIKVVDWIADVIP